MLKVACHFSGDTGSGVYSSADATEVKATTPARSTKVVMLTQTRVCTLYVALPCRRVAGSLREPGAGSAGVTPHYAVWRGVARDPSSRDPRGPGGGHLRWYYLLHHRSLTTRTFRDT